MTKLRRLIRAMNAAEAAWQRVERREGRRYNAVVNAAEKRRWHIVFYGPERKRFERAIREYNGELGQ